MGGGERASERSEDRDDTTASRRVLEDSDAAWSQGRLRKKLMLTGAELGGEGNSKELAWQKQGERGRERERQRERERETTRERERESGRGTGKKE